MVMAPMFMLAASAGHHDHAQNVPKGVRVQLLFEFSLYLIRKWFPDAHGAHPGVGGVDWSP